MISKAQQLRVATALAGVTAPPKGAKMVRQSDQPQRIDRVAPNQERAIKRAERARAASVSIRTTSGGGPTAPAPEGKGSLRAEIRAVMSGE